MRNRPRSPRSIRRRLPAGVVSTLVPIAGCALALLGPPAIVFAESGAPSDSGTSDAAAPPIVDSGATDAGSASKPDAGNPCANKILGSVCTASNGEQGTCANRECNKTVSSGGDGGSTLVHTTCIECVTPDPDDIGPQGSNLTGGACSASAPTPFAPFAPFATGAIGVAIAVLGFARRSTRRKD